MDEITTSGADVVDQAAAADPGAPWGYKPDGTAYKRDPDVMRRVREARFGANSGRAAGRPRAATPAARAPQKTAGATPKKRATPKYGQTVARWFVSGTSALLSDPVEQHIMRHQSVQLAVIVDRLLDEDPRLVAFVERLRLRLAGGAKGELLMWGVTTGGLVAVNRGYKHPVLAFALGGALEAIKLDAVRYEATVAADRAEMARLMEEYAREEAETVARYEADVSASMAAHPAGNGRGDVLGQFAGPG